MNKVTRGVKRRCTECDTAFYDMERSPIRCPKCGAELDVTAAKRLISSPRPARTAAPRGRPAAALSQPDGAAEEPAAAKDHDAELDDAEAEEDEREDDDGDEDDGDEVTDDR